MHPSCFLQLLFLKPYGKEEWLVIVLDLVEMVWLVVVSSVTQGYNCITLFIVKAVSLTSFVLDNTGVDSRCIWFFFCKLFTFHLLSFPLTFALLNASDVGEITFNHPENKLIKQTNSSADWPSIWYPDLNLIEAMELTEGIIHSLEIVRFPC